MRRFGLVLALLVAAACGMPVPEPDESAIIADPPSDEDTEISQVVVIGDSLAYGEGDESTRGIPGWLDEELARRGVEARPTRNFGRNGATTADVMARLRDPEVGRAIAAADAVVLSVGANDLVRTPQAREEAFRAPLRVAKTMLEQVAGVVDAIRLIAPDARILVLGGYNPVRGSAYGGMLERYLVLWDESLIERFEPDPKVEIVPMRDLVADPARLSSRDHFHPGEAAYRDLAARIAEILTDSAA